MKEKNLTKEYLKYITLARESIEKNDNESADKNIRKAISIEPSAPHAFNLLGALTEIKGDTVKAMKFYRAALALDPTYKAANDNLTRLSDATEEGDILLE